MKLALRQTVVILKILIIQEAADKGKWADFVKLMGGVFCKRNDQAIRPLYKEKLDTETGELKQSYFDEVVSISLRGIKLGEKEVITRVHERRSENRGTRAAWRRRCFYLEFCK